MEIIAPILINLPENKKRINFQDFFIRKIKKEEKEHILSFMQYTGDIWERGEINKSEFCLTTKINSDTDYQKINNFQKSIDNLRKTLRLIGCKINLSICTLGSNSVGSRGRHAQVSQVNDPYIVSNAEIKKIKKIFLNVKKLSSDKKFEAIFERYESAISEYQLPANRFIDAVTVLESLVLPNIDKGELKIRLTIITSNLLSKKYKINKRDTFSKIKEYYDIRSEFVHNAKSNKYTENKLTDLLDITRKILLLYVMDKKIFEEKNLENLLIN